MVVELPLHLFPRVPLYPQGARRIRTAAKPPTAAQLLRATLALVEAEALIGPKAPSTKRGLAERSEVWGSLKKLLPLYEEGGADGQGCPPLQGDRRIFREKSALLFGGSMVS